MVPGYSVLWQAVTAEWVWGSWSHGMHGQEAETVNARGCMAHFLSLSNPGIALPTAEIGFLVIEHNEDNSSQTFSGDSLIQIIPHRYAWRPLSWVILDTVNLAINTNDPTSQLDRLP